MVITKNIVFCQLCLTDQLFPLAFQLLKIIDLLLIHISPYFPQPCVTVVLITIVLITRMENRISSAVAIRHNFVPWNRCYVIFFFFQKTQSYKNTQLLHDTLMMTSKINRFLAKIIWIFLLGNILQGLIRFRR